MGKVPSCRPAALRKSPVGLHLYPGQIPSVVSGLEIPLDWGISLAKGPVPDIGHHGVCKFLVVLSECTCHTEQSPVLLVLMYLKYPMSVFLVTLYF